MRYLKNTTASDIRIADLSNLLVPANSIIDADIFGDQDLRASADVIRLLLDGVLTLLAHGSEYAGKAAVDEINGYAKQTTRDGKAIFTASDRPVDHFRSFYGRGDDLQTGQRGKGTPLLYDVVAGSEASIDVHFVDNVYVRDGRMLYKGAELGSFLNIWVMCPAGYPYQVPPGTGDLSIVNGSVVPTASGNLKLATEETVVYKFLTDINLFGDDEFELTTPEPFLLQRPYFLRFSVAQPEGAVTNLKGSINTGLYRAVTL